MFETLRFKVSGYTCGSYVLRDSALRTACYDSTLVCCTHDAHHALAAVAQCPAHQAGQTPAGVCVALLWLAFIATTLLCCTVNRKTV
jgi:hypothetical protein